MRVSHRFTAGSARFDEDNLVSHAGLVPLLELAEQTRLPQILAKKVSIKTARIKSGAANPVPKLLTVIAGMYTGADSIDDLDMLRAGGIPILFDDVYAASTLGTLLREFSFGHARQLESVLREHLVALAGRTPVLVGLAEQAFVDIDSLLRPVYGHAKQGASYGHTKIAGKQVLRKGLSPLATTDQHRALRTATAAPTGALERGARLPHGAGHRLVAAKPGRTPERAAVGWAGRSSSAAEAGRSCHRWAPFPEGALMSSSAESAAQSANQSAKTVATSKPVKIGARIGLVAYGITHLLIAWLALQLAFGGGGGQANQSGAFQELAQQPFGRALLWVLALGFVAVALCRGGFGHDGLAPRGRPGPVGICHRSPAGRGWSGRERWSGSRVGVGSRRSGTGARSRAAAAGSR